MNTIKEQEIQYAVDEMVYGLEQKGWIAPHSFVLRNPEEEREQYKRYEVRGDWMFQPHITMKFIQSHTKEDVAQARRTRYYGSSLFSKDDTLVNKGALREILRFAYKHGYNEIVEVRTQFSDIRNMCGIWRQEWESQVDSFPMVPLTQIDPTQFKIHCQGRGYHIAIHCPDRKVIQWDDDYELVHVAESFLLDRLYYMAHPAEGRGTHLKTNQSAKDLPMEGFYPVPTWLTRMIVHIQTGNGWIAESNSRDEMNDYLEKRKQAGY